MRGLDATQAHVLLREGTRHAHETTEASDGMHRLMAGDMGEAGYEALLEAQLGLFQTWEAERADWLRGDVAQAGWTYISRAALILDDLTVGARPARDISSRTPVGYREPGMPVGDREPGIPMADREPGTPVGYREEMSRAGRAPTAWGELYVVEGSALGGRIIARRLRELFPHRTHQFYAVGENAPSSWRHFQTLLDSHLTDDASRRLAIDGALTMFARFRQALTDLPAHA